MKTRWPTRPQSLSDVGLPTAVAPELVAVFVGTPPLPVACVRSIVKIPKSFAYQLRTNLYCDILSVLTIMRVPSHISLFIVAFYAPIGPNSVDEGRVLCHV